MKLWTCWTNGADDGEPEIEDGEVWTATAHFEGGEFGSLDISGELEAREDGTWEASVSDEFRRHDTCGVYCQDSRYDDPEDRMRQAQFAAQRAVHQAVLGWAVEWIVEIEKELGEGVS